MGRVTISSFEAVPEQQAYPLSQADRAASNPCQETRFNLSINFPTPGRREGCGLTLHGIQGIRQLMPNHDTPSENRQPTEAQLRRMLDARELEKEMARKQTSRNITKVLLLSAAVVIGAVFCFPSSRKIVTDAAHGGTDPAAQAAILSQQRAELAKAAASAAEVPEEMKPFVAKPSEDGLKSDIRFTMELMNFMQAPEPPRTAKDAAAKVPGKSP